jgi:hypothetical protein
MVIVYSKTLQKWVEVDGVIGRGRWWGRRWLVGIGMGSECLMLLVEACDESSVIDEIVDSKKWGGHIKSDEPCTCADPDQCDCVYGGNYGDRLDYELRIFEDKNNSYEIKFFASKELAEHINDYA